MVVDQGVVNGDTLCNVFLHPGDQLRGRIFQLVLSQKAASEKNMFKAISRNVIFISQFKCIFSIPVDNDNPIFVKRLKVIRCEEGANSARIFLHPIPITTNQSPITTNPIKIQLQPIKVQSQPIQ